MQPRGTTSEAKAEEVEAESGANDKADKSADIAPFERSRCGGKNHAGTDR